jgi:hypothetical protein
MEKHTVKGATLKQLLKIYGITAKEHKASVLYVEAALAKQKEARRLKRAKAKRVRATQTTLSMESLDF